MNIFKKIPISIKAATFIAAIFAIYLSYDSYTIADKIIKAKVYKLKVKLQRTDKYLTTNLANKNNADIADDLNSRIGSKDIEFYIISKSNNILFYKHKYKAHELNMLKIGKFNKYYVIGNTVFIKRIKNGTVYTYGVHLNNKPHLKMVYEFLFMNTLPLLLEVFAVFFGAFIFIEFFIRFALKFLISKLQSSDASNRFIQSIMSNEIDLLSKGIDGFTEDYKILKDNYKIIEKQVPAAIRKELMSGRKEFEEIECAMVTTDINNSSLIQHQFPKEVYIPIFKEVMNAITHVVETYGGNSYKFVGDEIIYYFRNDDFNNCSDMAVSAVRDIDHAVRKIHDKFKDSGVIITTKSAISFGTITFTLVDNTFEIMGGCITEATRILSLIEEKDRNVLFVSEIINKKASNIVTLEKAGVFNLKGLGDGHNIFSYTTEKMPNDILDNLTSSNVNELTYFRSQNDLQLIINYLTNHLTTIDEKLLFSISNDWKTFPKVDRGAEVSAAFINYIKILDKIYFNQAKDRKFTHYLSAGIGTILNIVHKNHYDSKLTELLVGFISEDYSHRIIANTIEALGAYESDQTDELVRKFLSHKNNRVRSNAIVSKGKNEFNKSTYKKLRKLLRNRDKLYIASGIYACREIIVHHKKTKRSYNVNIYFEKILEELYKHVPDKNELIRSQLKRTALYIDDEKLTQLLSIAENKEAA